MDSVEYVLAAIEQIERLAYYSDRIDWPAVHKRASATIAADAAPELTYREIRSILVSLQDGHSFLVPPHEGPQMATTVWGRVEVRRDSAQVGYIRLDGFFGGDRGEIDDFARILSDRIDALANDDVRGWIVDLRQNRGGNMWPMLGGLASIIGTRDLGQFVYRNGMREPWNVDESVALPLFRTSQLTAPVAVMIGEVTASSGEAVAIAFMGRHKSRLFGEPTRGLSSSNETIRLIDGARLMLTTSLFADRAGKVHSGSIWPDERVADEHAIFEAARNWITSRLQDIEQ